ncbi:MAG: ATP-binding protein [Solirubrobacteraceae bacterium MAG38_C4-C5]|nr:ATP-binding protein [Candidatus Siliceabacter maunaloa]
MTKLRARLLGDTRTRILATFVLLLAASTLVSTVLLRALLLDSVDNRLQTSLAQEIEEFRTLAREGVDPLTGERFVGARRLFDVYLSRNVPDREEDWYTFARGRPYRTTAGSSPSAFGTVAGLSGLDEPRQGQLEGPDGALAYVAVPVQVAGERRGAYVAVAALGRERREVDQAAQLAAGVSLGVLIGASLLAYVLAGRILAPLREVTNTARTISETDLSKRIEVAGQDEISVLARTFNEMLDRLDAAFETQRAFVSDAGHELRTPITVVRGHLELLGRRLPEGRETIELVTDELDRMNRIVDDLLTLAKAERSDFLAVEDLDLDVLTEEVYAKARALGQRRWELEAAAPGRLTGDRQRLTQALMNLAANAAQSTQPGTRIAIGSALGDGDGEARLWVADEGPGIDPAEHQRIFERFARGAAGRRRSEGAGLGLSIVRAIAEAHGGRVELRSGVGRGARFTIHLPVGPPPAPEPDDDEEVSWSAS